MSGLEHFDRELGELDKQIVRLGKLCGLDLSHEETVTALLRGEIGPERFPPDVRKLILLLKGLLALRYQVEKQCVEDVGPAHCREILDTTLLK